MSQPITKYKIGLAVVGLFTVAITIWALAQAGATKQDNNTYNTANNIANKLNSYTESNDTAPYSLSYAGVNNPPSTITYTRLSDSSYRFCIYYKTASSNFDASSAESDLFTSSVSDSNSYSGSLDYGANGYLFIDTSHHKGNNCQVVNLYTDSTNFQYQ